ncbi:MAG: class E sortase [Microbacteriaceae bacterium]|nr:MAG: class E sortase [Microbacteriaceae bacterium]
MVGVFGELLITAGLIVLLFIGWQTWWNSAVLAGQQTSAAATQSRQWMEQGRSQHQPSPPATSGSTPVAAPAPADSDPPPVMQPVAFAQPLAVIYIPRFGADWKRIIRESVDVQSVLNSYDAGVGHYTGTQMPGAVGNFAIAAHDTGYGNAFLDMSKLQLGDKIYIQTKEGFYTYEFRNFQYVRPTAVNVLLPVPQMQGATATDRLITLTTCNPPYHAQERIATFGVFDSWQPLSDVPAAIVTQVNGG